MTKERLMELGNLEEESALKILEELEKEQPKEKQVSEEEKEELRLEYEEKLKLFATKHAIRLAGGKNEKAILALLDLEKVQLQEDGTLSGLELDKVKAEVPYLFEKTEKKTKGTGFSSGRIDGKKEETAKKFKDALLRR